MKIPYKDIEENFSSKDTKIKAKEIVHRNNNNQNLMNSYIFISNNTHLGKIENNTIIKSKIINLSKSHKKENLISSQTNNIEKRNITKF